MNNSKILIVEDEAIVALEIKYRLTKLGYTVCGTASTGARALQLAEQTNPDLVLMDVKLKGNLNGIETAAILKEKSGIQSIFLSAFSEDSTKKQMIDTRNYEFLQKPFEAEALKAVIEKILNRKESETETID